MKSGIEMNQTPYESMTDMLAAFYNGDVRLNYYQ